MKFVTQYQAYLWKSFPEPEKLGGVCSDYECMLHSTMSVLLERTERNSDYGWIDMKFDLLSGQDYPSEDPLRGRNAVYGWIQGRGLEALAEHYTLFLSQANHDPEAKVLAKRIEPVLRRVLDRLRNVRELNGEHLYFFLTEEGKPFRVDGDKTLPVHLKKDDPSNFSDIFGAKGMLAAANALNDLEATQEALDYMRQTEANVLTGRFVSDQQTLDSRFPITSVPGRQAQGPLMIQLGAMALRMRIAPQADDIAIGLALLRYLFNRHTCFEQRNLQAGDFWEFVDEVGKPWLDAKKRLIVDPGHALELTGLGMKWIIEVQHSNLATKEELEELQQHQKSLFQIFVRNFEIGFQVEQGGICKSFDLIHNRPINSDMPWWSLPETMRAALFFYSNSQNEEQREKAAEVYRLCHNAFIKNYVRQDRCLMAIQTRNADGEPVAVIPATSDADPGYHTGLSLLDCLAILRQQAV